MRITCLALIAVCLLGCGKIDSGRSDTELDPGAPTVTRPDDAARLPTTPADDAARPPDVARGEPKAAARDIEPDNTGVNTRDANRTTREPKLPIDQKETQQDVGITAKIRRRVVGTEGLSINAQNVKIITADGKVTLRGPVESAAERERIATIAREVAGKDNVDDQIEVKSATDSSPPNANP